MSVESVLVLAETRRGALTRGTREVITAGRYLADALGKPLVIAVAGAQALGIADEAVVCGADLVWVVDMPDGEQYQPQGVVAATAQACREHQPRAILLAHSLFGCDIAPRLAYRLDTYWGSGCVGLRLAEDGEIVHTRVEMGGKLLVDETCTQVPVVLTLRAGVWTPAAAGAGRNGLVQRFELESASLTKHIHILEHVSRGENLDDQLVEAQIVVGGGQGLGGERGVQAIKELADLLGGMTGASRAAVDRGYLPRELQVGLSGSTIAPRVYIAVGISGSSQHLAGCSGAKTIIVINSDPNAPFFRHAQYGIVGKWEMVLPPVVEALRGHGRQERLATP